MTVGRRFRAGDVISRSARILYKSPVMMLPPLIIFIPTLLGEPFNSPPFARLRLVAGVVQFVLSPIVVGAYPSMVKAAIGGRPISVTESLANAYHRYWSLLVATIVVGLLVTLGLVALVVPGVILGTWYVYTFPAMMLEDKGAMQGMSASKAFGRDKKFDTFVLFLALVVGSAFLVGAEFVFSLASHLLGQLVYAILGVPFQAWVLVMFSYAYLTYGPSSAPVAEDYRMPQLIRDVVDSFKAKGLQYISLTEARDPKKSILTYKDAVGQTITKEIPVRLVDLEEAVRGLDAMNPGGLADYLLSDFLGQS
jgi:hypothetical protein